MHRSGKEWEISSNGSNEWPRLGRRASRTTTTTSNKATDSSTRPGIPPDSDDDSSESGRDVTPGPGGHGHIRVHNKCRATLANPSHQKGALLAGLEPAT
eukprot:3457945-Rhodomonas_salina.1